MARSYHAEAFTAGSDIVFGAGRYGTGSAGRSLLAHELAHVVQQSGGNNQIARKLSPAGAMVQRQCTPSPCPAASIEIGSFPPTPKQAEVCLQTMYAASPGSGTPGISLAFNKSWVLLKTGDKKITAELDCLRGGVTAAAGVNYTAKGGKAAAEPDIWDFKARTMYEITTRGQLDFKSGDTGKLKAQIALVNKLLANPDCNAMAPSIPFRPGEWKPPGPCYLLPSTLYIKVENISGVLIYTVLKDISKELLEATALATLAALLAKYGPNALKTLKGFGPKAGGAVAARAAWVYAVASLAATAILLASGKAEAKVGPGDEEPLVQLFKAMDQKGTPVPPEIQKMIEADPELKAIIEKSMKKGGDPTEAQNALNEKILKIIAENKDQFTKEDLEAIATSTAVAGKALPDSNLTAGKVRKMIDAAKSGDIGDGGGGEADGKKNVWQKAAEGSGPGGSGGEKGSAGGEKAPDKPTVWDKAKYPGLKEDALKKVLGMPPPVKKLFDAMLGQQGLKLSDDVVNKFTDAVPSDLTDAESQAMQSKLAPGDDKTTLEDVIKSIKEGVADARKKKADEAAAAADAAILSIDPTPPKPGAKMVSASEIRDKLAQQAKSGDYSKVEVNATRLFWGEEKDNRIDGTVKGRDIQGNNYAGRMTAKVTGRSVDAQKRKVLTATCVGATDWVYADGTIFRNAASILGKQQVITVLTPDQKK